MTPLMKLRLETAFGASSPVLEPAFSDIPGHPFSGAAAARVLREEMHLNQVSHLSSWIPRNNVRIRKFPFFGIASRRAGEPLQAPAILLTEATAGCCECLDANVVRTGGLMGANAVPNYVQIAPADDAIDQPLTAAILKIRFVEAQPHKDPCKEDNILSQGLRLLTVRFMQLVSTPLAKAAWLRNGRLR